MLTSLGLTPAEQDLYEHLVSCSPASLAELVDRYGDPIRSTVERLVTLRLAVRLEGPPERVTVVSPDAVLEPLYLAYARELADIRGQLLAQAAQTDAESVAGQTHPPVELLHEPDAMVAAHEEVKMSVKNMFRFWDTPPYLSNPRKENPNDDKILERGAAARVVYDPQAVNIPGRPTEMIREADQDVYARVADVPVKLSIADQTLALVIRVAGDHVEGLVEGLVVREPTLVAALTALFELYWERGVPLGAHAAEQFQASAAAGDPTKGEPQPPPPDALDRQLLVLLGAGLTDREIGEHLGYHERTVRNRIQRIKDRLGARTRYQAGYLAARQGWTSPGRRSNNGGDDSAAG